MNHSFLSKCNTRYSWPIALDLGKETTLWCHYGSFLVTGYSVEGIISTILAKEYVFYSS